MQRLQFASKYSGDIAKCPFSSAIAPIRFKRSSSNSTHIQEFCRLQFYCIHLQNAINFFHRLFGFPHSLINWRKL